MNEFYKTNQDFKDYVDKYCAKHHIDKDEAFTHSLVISAYEYYKNNSLQ